MKINFMFKIPKRADKSLADYKRENLSKLGTLQFKKMVEKGISLPVHML